MPIYQRSKTGWQVYVSDVTADRGFERVRVTVGSKEAAEALEAEIGAALRDYGRWPLREDSLRRGERPTPRQAGAAAKRSKAGGTLREATRLALETHWRGKSWEATVSKVIWYMVDFFETVRGKRDIDAITSADVDAFVADCRSRGNSASTINKKLSMLRVISTVAMERRPPLAKAPLPTKRVAVKPVLKWWLTPARMELVVEHLERGGDTEYLDYLLTMVLQGLRPGEAIAQCVDDVIGLGTDRPSLRVQGTKTTDAQTVIPIFAQSVGLYSRAVERAKLLRRERLFGFTMRQAMDRWREVRAILDCEDDKTATLKSLRRTWTYYATEKGMPLHVMQTILRHTSISTTEGYTRLAGYNKAEAGRDYL